MDACGTSETCDNLSWHTALSVNQEAGNEQMSELMEIATYDACQRLKGDWLVAGTFGVRDVYAMQLLHCYDIVSGRQSPWEECFTPSDWIGFEYLRDTKYHFSEGYGCDAARSYAVPWLQAGLRRLGQQEKVNADFPLHVAFTHREEVLYLCCLLGIAYEPGWMPDLTRVDQERQWRVSLLAPYLGHVGIETYYRKSGHKSLRVIVNGGVGSAFFGQLQQDQDGGYDFSEVGAWACEHPCRWKGFRGL